MLADCGGVAGVNFCKKFLGGEGGFAAVARHLKHMVKVAGEDTPCFGSDWDGVPAGGISVLPRDMGKLKNYLGKRGFTQRMLEKIFCGNFLRVLRSVAG